MRQGHTSRPEGDPAAIVSRRDVTPWKRKTRWGGSTVLGALSADRAEDTEILQALMVAGHADRVEFMGS